MIYIKTWEVYKMALENPRAKFKLLTDCIDKGKVFKTSRGDIFVEDIKNGCSLLVPRIDSEWELVREPVDFMTAINSGKPISSRDGKIRGCAPEFIIKHARGCLDIDRINGQWYIED